MPLLLFTPILHFELVKAMGNVNKINVLYRIQNKKVKTSSLRTNLVELTDQRRSEKGKAAFSPPMDHRLHHHPLGLNQCVLGPQRHEFLQIRYNKLLFIKATPGRCTHVFYD